MKKLIIPLLALSFILASCEKEEEIISESQEIMLESVVKTSKSTIAGASKGGVFFDDFSYSSKTAMRNFGWTIRNASSGGPGQGSWSSSNVSFVSIGTWGKAVELRAITSGSVSTTSRAAITSPRKFGVGTYAARVWFPTVPKSGLNLSGDKPIQTFFGYSSYADRALDSYSEFDFEYLPHGGWGTTDKTMHVTSYERAPDPGPSAWERDTDHFYQNLGGGWHILVMQLSASSTKYYIDGVLKATHYSPYTVDGNMAMFFNIWYIGNGINTNVSSQRVWRQQIDWFYAAPGNATLTPSQVSSAVVSLRSNGKSNEDTTY